LRLSLALAESLLCLFHHVHQLVVNLLLSLLCKGYIDGSYLRLKIFDYMVSEKSDMFDRAQFVLMRQLCYGYAVFQNHVNVTMSAILHMGVHVLWHD